MYSTYVLYSPGFNKIYIGFSSELTNRLMAHNDSRNRGWSSKYQPWELLYSEEHHTKSEAMKREKQLKKNLQRQGIYPSNSQGQNHPSSSVVVSSVGLVRQPADDRVGWRVQYNPLHSDKMYSTHVLYSPGFN